MKKETHSPTAVISTSYGSKPPLILKNAGTFLPWPANHVNVSDSTGKCNVISLHEQSRS